MAAAPTSAARQSRALDKTLQMIRELLPAPGAALGEYVFLSPDALWTGRTGKHPFVAVAEDRWSSNSGQFLAVLTTGPVYVADLKDNGLINYCAASFPQFLKISELYAAAMESAPTPSVFDDDGFRQCEEIEQALRRQITEVDPSALELDSNFWSTRAEELGYGM